MHGNLLGVRPVAQIRSHGDRQVASVSLLQMYLTVPVFSDSGGNLKLGTCSPMFLILVSNHVTSTKTALVRERRLSHSGMG